MSEQNLPGTGTLSPKAHIRADLLSRIPVAKPTLSGNESSYVQECIETTWISSQGRFLEDFEREFAKFCDTKFAIACNNGTTALHLALAALDVSRDDEIIVPDLTYIASANCVHYCGATPVFVDCDPRTFNIDPSDIERAITPRTRGIIAVHLYGHPCDMDAIREVADRHGLFVLEDAAEAHGALYKGKKVGGLGTCASFSFFGNKIITTGEGGAVTTDDPKLAARLKLLRGQGMDPNRRYWFPEVGYNYRMTNVAAAIGLAQLEKVEEFLTTRKKIATWYDEKLSAIELVERPFVSSEVSHSFWMYTVLIAKNSGVPRDKVAARLDELGIETRPVFYPMHVLPPYAQSASNFSRAADCSARGLNLPTHVSLSEADVERVCESLSYALTA